jgi:hypothetical protein
MTYTIYMEAKITDNDNEDEVAAISRSLAKLPEVTAHFGKSVAVTAEGVELGMETSA